MACAKDVIGIAANFDPTGILSMVKAFMYKTCDMTPVWNIAKL